MGMLDLTRVLDHYDDDGLLLRREFAERGIPAIVKTAADLSDNKAPLGEDYALAVSTEFGSEYKYPIVDAGNTLASAVYFSEYGDHLPTDLQKEAAQKLNEALVSFGFDPPETLTKTAAMELGYTTEGEDQSLKALFGFGAADNQFEELKDAFDSCSPRGKRRLMLQVKEAGVLDASLVKEASGDISGLGRLIDYAGDSYGSDLAMALDLRKIATLSTSASEELDGLLAKKASTNPTEFAEELQAFDTRNSISHLYGRVIPDPYASVFGTQIAKTAEVVSPLDIGGKTYAPNDVVDFADTGSDQLSEAFGQSFADQFASDPVHVLDSLPMTHKQAIARMIDESQT